MSDEEDFTGVEHSKSSVTKNSLTFLLEGIDPRDLAADGLSIISFADSEWSTGGVREDPTCQELAIEGECLTKQGNHSEAIPLLESALELGTDDMQLLSVLWSLLGNAHFYLGDYEKASICHQHDLAICNELGDERNQAQAYCNLGIANRKTGYLHRAKLCYERYLDICEKIEDSRSRSKANHNLGDLHLTLARLKLQRKKNLEESEEAKDHLTKAAEYFTKHLEYVKETQNKSAEARAHANLGLIYELLQDIDKAIDHYEQRLKIAVEINDKGAEGRSYCSIGNCLRAMVQPEKSIECYNRGLAIAEELEDKIGEGIVSGNLGMAYEMLCNLEEAQEHYKKQLDFMRSRNNLYGEAMALDNVARIYEYMANIGKACESLEELLPILRKLKRDEEEQVLVSRINRLNEMRGVTKTKDGNINLSGSTGTGLIGTWKKLKGKKKQRNLTAPEISSQDLKAAMSKTREAHHTSSATLESLKEKDDKKDGGKIKGKGIFGKKLPKEKLSPESKDSPKPRKSESLDVKNSEVVFKNDMVVESPSNSEETILSQKSEPIMSNDDQNSQDIEITLTLPADPTSKPNDSIVLEPLNLSQTSGKHSLLSQSGTCIGNEEHYSTQSSSDIIGTEGTQELDIPMWDNGKPIMEEVDIDFIDNRYYLQGSSKLYKEYGSKQHRLNLERVNEFLESSGESEPMNLSELQDWDGWMLASKDLVIPATSSKESKLI